MCRSNREAQVLTAVEQMKAKPPPPVTCVENEDDSDEENAPQVRHLTFICKFFKVRPNLKFQRSLCLSLSLKLSECLHTTSIFWKSDWRLFTELSGIYQFFNKITLFCLIVGAQIANFWEKTLKLI